MYEESVGAFDVVRLGSNFNDLNDKCTLISLASLLCREAKFQRLRYLPFAPGIEPNLTDHDQLPIVIRSASKGTKERLSLLVTNLLRHSISPNTSLRMNQRTHSHNPPS